MSRKEKVQNEGTDKLVAERMAKRFSAEFRRFVNVQLNSKQKEHFIAWATENNYFTVLNKHTSLGRTFNCKRDFKQGCYIATCLERDVESPNAGLMVSARGAEADMASWRLLFILDFVFGDDRWDSVVDLSGDLW